MIIGVWHKSVFSVAVGAVVDVVVNALIAVSIKSIMGLFPSLFQLLVFHNNVFYYEED